MGKPGLVNLIDFKYLQYKSTLSLLIIQIRLALSKAVNSASPLKILGIPVRQSKCVFRIDS